MNKLRQDELIKKMTDREILLQLYLTQGILFLLAIIGGWLFYPSIPWKILFLWDTEKIIMYSIPFAITVVGVDLFLMKVLPKSSFDDGGVNEKVFQNRTTSHILWMTLLISFCEELLFRGILQSKFGLIMASMIFALIHIRYLYKPVLFISVFLISFSLGVMFDFSQNFWVVMIAHFLIDFLLALFIRYQR